MRGYARRRKAWNLRPLKTERGGLLISLIYDALAAEFLAGSVRLRELVDAHAAKHLWCLGELDFAVVDDLDVVAPRIQEVEGAASLDVDTGLLKGRADALLVIDDEPEVPSLVGRLRSAGLERDELVAHVDEGHRPSGPPPQLEFEEASVPRHRLVDVTDLERDVVDADEACHR